MVTQGELEHGLVSRWNPLLHMIGHNNRLALTLTGWHRLSILDMGFSVTEERLSLAQRTDGYLGRMREFDCFLLQDIRNIGKETT